MDLFGDLHTHTAHSREADNFLEERLKSYAQAKKEFPNLEVVGILDHDTLNYLEPMYRTRRLFEPSSLPLILPGIEISSAFEHPTKKGKFVQTHLIGYFPKLIQEDNETIIKVNSVLESPLNKSIEGKLKKNVDLRLAYFFKNGIIPESQDFEELKKRIIEKYRADKQYVESKEPKENDIINWTLNSSDKMVLEVLVEEGIIGSMEEGKLYVDRVSEDKANKLANIFKERSNKPYEESMELAKRLQGSCHGDYNDDFYKLTTQDSIRLVREAGGIAILAHPMVSLKKFKGESEDFFSYCASNLVPIGLQGMEAFYPNQEKLTPQILEFCKSKGLYVTGGSDDHQDGRNNIGEEGSRCPINYIKEMLKKED